MTYSESFFATSYCSGAIEYLFSS